MLLAVGAVRALGAGAAARGLTFVVVLGLIVELVELVEDVTLLPLFVDLDGLAF